jgi:hypothetical protein
MASPAGEDAQKNGASNPTTPPPPGRSFARVSSSGALAAVMAARSPRSPTTQPAPPPTTPPAPPPETPPAPPLRSQADTVISVNEKEKAAPDGKCLPTTQTLIYDWVVRIVYTSVVLAMWWTIGNLLPLLGGAIAPNGAGFALGLLYAFSTFCSAVVKFISPRLPPLLGMLLAGLLLRNIHPWFLGAEVPLLGHSFEWWSFTLRSSALAVIMLRAGLGLDLEKLRVMGLVTARLACFPCLAEATTVALVSRFILDLPAAWAGLLGFVIAAVSPAVVVPGMLDLQTRGYGTEKGIPSMVIAAASFDDVLAIAGFGVTLALALSGESDTPQNFTWLVLKAPVELVAGIFLGIIAGFFVASPPAVKLGTNAHTLGALGAAFLAIFGGKYVKINGLNFSGGGALAAVVIGCTAARLWPTASLKAVQKKVNWCWGIAQPALFALLGASVKLHAINPEDLGAGIFIIAISLAVRISVTRLAMFGSTLNTKEALLVCVAWMPKATVQAAVGGTALDMVVELSLGPTAVARAELVLMLSVLVILITAPIGAIGIASFGPKYLIRELKHCDSDAQLDGLAAVAPSTPVRGAVLSSDGKPLGGLAAKDAAAYTR